MHIEHLKRILHMHFSRIMFLLGFNILTTFVYSATTESTQEITEEIQNLTLAPTPIEQPMIINGHTLTGVAPSVSKEDIIAKRAEMMTALMNLIDYAFTFYGGISLGLANVPFNPETTDREVFRKALKESMLSQHDPAAIVVGLEEMDFYQSLTKKTENEIKKREEIYEKNKILDAKRTELLTIISQTGLTQQIIDAMKQALNITESELMQHIEKTQLLQQNQNAERDEELRKIHSLKTKLKTEKRLQDTLTKFMCIPATDDFVMRLKLFMHATINKNNVSST